jgi:hypothetical protein
MRVATPARGLLVPLDFRWDQAMANIYAQPREIPDLYNYVRATKNAAMTELASGMGTTTVIV